MISDRHRAYPPISAAAMTGIGAASSRHSAGYPGVSWPCVNARILASGCLAWPAGDGHGGKAERIEAGPLIPGTIEHGSYLDDEACAAMTEAGAILVPPGASSRTSWRT